MWAVACDHAAVALKNAVVAYLKGLGLPVTDHGVHTPDSVDYPDMADTVAADILSGRAAQGILLCGTGIGVSIRANRYQGIRAALVHSAETARLARTHNNANVLCLGGRVLTTDEGIACVKAFLDAVFEGGRHAQRVAKLDAPLAAQPNQKKTKP